MQYYLEKELQSRNISPIHHLSYLLKFQIPGNKSPLLGNLNAGKIPADFRSEESWAFLSETR